MTYKVIGITSGIGSLQYGAQMAGFEVLHSHEWRKYYNSGSFEENYKKPLTPSYDPDSRYKGVDLIVSHPECGNFSNLYTGPNSQARLGDPGDIWKFIDLCKLYEPKFFLVDNLPKSLLAVSAEDWINAFPDYNIEFEYVSNWGYGNTQKNRNRLFIIGSHKDLNYHFVPGETKHDLTLGDAIEGIPEGTPNHQKMKLEDLTQWAKYQIGVPGDSTRLTLKELQTWFSSIKPRANMPYYNKSGELKSKPGYSIVELDHPSPVLSGGGGFYDNHWLFDEKDKYYRPLTIRERLRIQGFGDEFVLVPDKFEFGSKEHQALIKQSGKCMPVNFPRYFADQIKNFLDNGELPERGSKVIKQINIKEICAGS